MSEAYHKKARLIHDIGNIEQYRPILDKDNFQDNEPHWRRISKNSITLFQVLIDQDLIDLVEVLEHYPKYIEWVCEHFRYAYSYSENDADIVAASKLLFMGEPYFSKQFVRNVVRKLPKLGELQLEEISKFSVFVQTEHLHWHPIVTNYFINELSQVVENSHIHPLQRVLLLKPILNIKTVQTYVYDTQDRDAVLDIPYMN